MKKVTDQFAAVFCQTVKFAARFDVVQLPPTSDRIGALVEGNRLLSSYEAEWDPFPE
jgi:hypothetical protein